MICPFLLSTILIILCVSDTNYEITCDFEENKCPLTNQETNGQKEETWNKVLAAGQHPSTDHTTGSGEQVGANNICSLILESNQV